MAARFLGVMGIRVTLIFVVLMLILMGNMVLVVFPICVYAFCCCLWFWCFQCDQSAPEQTRCCDALSSRKHRIVSKYVLCFE